MRGFLNSLIIGLVAGLGLWAANSRADLEVSGSVEIHAKAEFYEPLSAHGAWIEVGSYGLCWHPARVAVEWRPYCDGHWVWTDCGWYWVSDEPWAWACYHYGWWVYDPTYAWIWVPAVEWAPAWVSWRVGGGYIGWAPLAPRGVVIASLPAPPFIFVETHRFHEPLRPSTVINNIKEETRTVGSLGPRKVMINEGPGLEPIQKATGKRISVVPIHDAVRQTPVPHLMARNRPDFKGKGEAPAVKAETPAVKDERPAVKGEGPPPKLNPREPGKGTDPIVPTPERPSARETPPGVPSKPSGEKAHGKGRGDKD